MNVNDTSLKTFNFFRAYNTLLHVMYSIVTFQGKQIIGSFGKIVFK